MDRTTIRLAGLVSRMIACMPTSSRYRKAAIYACLVGKMHLLDTANPGIKPPTAGEIGNRAREQVGTQLLV